MPDTFTPEQISQILEEFFKVVGTRQYIGARYVPIFGRKDEESIEWDNTGDYEPLTIVLYQGNSYTSRQFVPVGVEITNQEFWALTGNYNAQVEMYRRETAAAREVAEGAQSDINTLLPKDEFSAENTVKDYVGAEITGVTDIIGADFSSENTVSDFASDVTTILNGFTPEGDSVKAYVDDAVGAVQTDIDTLLPKASFSESNTVKDYVDTADSTLNNKIDNLIEENDYTEITTTDKDYFPFGDTVGIPDKPETIVFGEDNTYKQAIYNAGYNFWATGVLDLCNMIATANTYLKNYTQFVYGGSYNAMCLVGDYDNPTWLDPKQYKDPQNRMRIECNAFAQLIGHGVTFSNSTYSGTNTINSMRHQMFNYFSPSVKPYMLFGQQYMDEFPSEGVILQSWEFAKMLYDAGRLEPVQNIASAFMPGYLYFSGSVSNRFLNIGHCYYIGGFLGDSTDAKIVIESTDNFVDGYGIGCHKMSNTNYVGNTHGKYLPPFNGSFIHQRLGNRNNYQLVRSISDLAANPLHWSPDYTSCDGAAVLALTVNGTTAKNITFSATYDRDINQNVSYTISNLRGSYLVVVPYGYTLDVTSVSSDCSVEVVMQMVNTDKAIVIPERSS